MLPGTAPFADISDVGANESAAHPNPSSDFLLRLDPMKHTARSSAFLASIRREWNASIYRRVLHAYNDGGERAAIEVLAQYSLAYRERLAELDAGTIA
jgi:hypothetical protein